MYKWLHHRQNNTVHYIDRAWPQAISGRAFAIGSSFFRFYVEQSAKNSCDWCFCCFCCTKSHLNASPVRGPILVQPVRPTVRYLMIRPRKFHAVRQTHNYLNNLLTIIPNLMSSNGETLHTNLKPSKLLTAKHSHKLTAPFDSRECRDNQISKTNLPFFDKLEIGWEKIMRLLHIQLDPAANRLINVLENVNRIINLIGRTIWYMSRRL